MSNNFEDLQKQVADLTARVWRLEQASQANATQQPRNMPAAPSEAVAAAPRLSGKVQATTLETRIGSQLFNRIGIIALLIGMAWFLKLAIDNEWFIEATDLASEGDIVACTRDAVGPRALFSYFLKLCHVLSNVCTFGYTV